MIFANALIRKGIEIEVLESPTVGIIGVGEGSTPWRRGFFDGLGIEESEWMPASDATYKCVRRMVDQARFRELLPPVRVDARQPDDDAVRPQRARASERRGRVDASQPVLLAVGLAQGFIEPLEATALLFIQRTAMHFVEFLEAGDLSESAHDRFNQRVNDHFEGTRDYIVTHYKTNTRRDTEYWLANAANTNLSDSLR